MKYCVEKHLKKLKTALEQKKIFKPDLKTSTFLCILEILYNICGKKNRCRKCFSKENLSSLKKEKTALRYLFNKQKGIKKRKKKFVTFNSDFQQMIQNVLEQFFTNCMN